MSLRLKEISIFLVLLASGAILTPGTISGDAGRVLAVFLGLFSASILPTISLIINSMSASGRSVKALNELEVELQAAMDALLFIFGFIITAIAALVALSIEPAGFMRQIPYLTTQILPRAGQALVVAGAGMVIWRAGQIPGILRRSLKVRHQISIDEARSKIEKNAPSISSVRGSFNTHPDFGKEVTLEELHSKQNRK